MGPLQIDQAFAGGNFRELRSDPFSLRFLPDSNRFNSQNRFFSLGCSSAGSGIFAVYTSTGKVIRVLAARPMTDEENYFYSRKSKENL